MEKPMENSNLLQIFDALEVACRSNDKTLVIELLRQFRGAWISETNLLAKEYYEILSLPNTTYYGWLRGNFRHIRTVARHLDKFRKAANLKVARDDCTPSLAAFVTMLERALSVQVSYEHFEACETLRRKLFNLSD